MPPKKKRKQENLLQGSSKMACLQSFSKPASSINVLKKSSSFASTSSADAVIAASAVEKTAVSSSLLVDPVGPSSTHFCPSLASLPEFTPSGESSEPKSYVSLLKVSATLEELRTPSEHVSGAPFVLIPDENI
ncbi:hypothetical protein Bca4012_067199 [Brassica carinata]